MMMAYDYEGYLNKIKEYCSSNEDMKTAVYELENVISVMYKKLRSRGDGFSFKDYTREEVKNNSYLMSKLYTGFVHEVVEKYCTINADEYNNYYSDFDLCRIDPIYFNGGNVRIDFKYEYEQDEYRHGYIVLTEDEFFNGDIAPIEEKFKKDYEERINKKKISELNCMKRKIERYKESLNTLISEYENLNNDVHDNETR